MDNRVKILQKYLIKKSWDAFIIPRADEYLSEYIAPYAERLKWISGFSGSAGIAIIFPEKAAIFTDGRYKLQIQKEVNNRLFSIHNIRDYYEYIKNHIPENSTIAIDPWLFSKNTIDKIKKKLFDKKVKIHFQDKNPIDLFWKDQPQRPLSKAFLQTINYAGEDFVSKIKKIKKELVKRNCDYFLVTSLDSIAWILNLRGSDIDNTPVNLAYFILPASGKTTLYTDLKKFNKLIISKLSPYVEIKGYKFLYKRVSNISSTSVVGIDDNRTPYWFVKELIKNNVKLKSIDDPCNIRKAIKNRVELKGAKNANLRDGVSVTKFLYWLKNKINIEKENEISASNKLYEFRKNNELFFSLSFDSISAFGKHAALPHYRATKKSNSQFSNDSIYLTDSGGQYFDGTTDITRTIILGSASDEQKDRFTRVLKGHIALASTIFSKKTRGSEIDYVARKSLQEINCDFDHGTGHGIGSFLGVHEGPQKIYKSNEHKDQYLEPGMILSNEPGYYKDNEYGIRIENLVIVKVRKDKKFYFETISWAPIDRDLILLKLLNNFEKKWINEYHNKVYNNLEKFLEAKEKNWLKNVTKPF